MAEEFLICARIPNPSDSMRRVEKYLLFEIVESNFSFEVEVSRFVARIVGWCLLAVHLFGIFMHFV